VACIAIGLIFLVLGAYALIDKAVGSHFIFKTILLSPGLIKAGIASALIGLACLASVMFAAKKGSSSIGLVRGQIKQLVCEPIALEGRLVL
jgi:hypothetical protein